MKSREEIISIAQQTIQSELDAMAGLKNAIDNDFADVVALILKSEGRVIITGIGKSAIIANKIVSTLNSTGTPAVFMHAADAIHGDLGIIQESDLVICLSKSGETAEIKVLVPLLKQHGNKLVALVGNSASYLARSADYVLDTTVPKEACPNNLAPTASTTAQLVMGDALAVALLECRGFSAHDFARLHPGGSLGKQLYLRVSDLYIHNEKPMVEMNADIRQVILEISAKRLGATAVMDKSVLAGIITDGDLRRMLEKITDISAVTAADIMTRDPKTIDAGNLVVEALALMRSHNITQLPVMENGRYAGVIHLHDILKEGIL
ncbi:MAG: KpsF/GutQ family sugar-phosphate isomerase [Bacteroidales bacterium]